MACTNCQTAFTRISLVNGRGDRQVKFQMQSSWGVKKTKTTKPTWEDQEVRNCEQGAGYGACKDNKRRRHCFVKQDSLAQDSDIEEDGLRVIGVEESQLDGPPKRIDPIYMTGKFRRPFLRSDSERLTSIFACFGIKTESVADYSQYRDFEDSIKAVSVQTTQTFRPPDEVDSSSAWMRTSPRSPVEKEIFKYGRPRTRRQHSIVENLKRLVLNKGSSGNSIRSQIKIGHLLQDHVLGDDFGAEIESYAYKDKDHNGYFLHFFINIEQNSVAQHLTLREFDELVLLNDEFVPSLTHDELIAKFKSLPVDSHTPLKLIIRRMQKEHDIKEIEFQWIRIQAILVPEYDREPSTIVRDCHTERLESAPSGTSTMCLKLQDSSKYMSIQNHVIGACFLQGDKSDTITHITMNWRILVSSQNEPQTYFLASLCSDQNGYVSVKGQEVNLAEQPFEFTYSKEGGLRSFMVKDKYLGYDGDTITLKSQPYRFEAFPAMKLKFHPNATPNSSFSSHSSGYSSLEVDD